MKISNERIQKATTNIGSFYINYDISYKGESFSSITGVVRKSDGTRAMSVQYSAENDNLYISGKIGDISKKEFSSIIAAISNDVNELR